MKHKTNQRQRNHFSVIERKVSSFHPVLIISFAPLCACFVHSCLTKRRNLASVNVTVNNNNAPPLSNCPLVVHHCEGNKANHSHLGVVQGSCRLRTIHFSAVFMEMLWATLGKQRHSRTLMIRGKSAWWWVFIKQSRVFLLCTTLLALHWNCWQIEGRKNSLLKVN